MYTEDESTTRKVTHLSGVQPQHQAGAEAGWQRQNMICCREPIKVDMYSE